MRQGDEIFHSWYAPESDHGSGPGSTIEATGGFRVYLEDFIRDHEIKSILDYGCGDFIWMRHVDLHGATYLGVDIVSSLIERLGVYPHHDFIVIDPETYNIPCVDLILCKDVLQHLPNNEIRSLIAKMQAKAKYVLFVNDGPKGDEPCNVDIDRGGWRRIDLHGFGVSGRVVFDLVGAPDAKIAFLWSSAKDS